MLKMVENGQEPRPTRRHARVQCEARIARQAASGFSTNLSIDGLHLRIPRDGLDEHDVRPGSPVAIKLRLTPNQPPLRAEAEVVWINTLDVDIGGRPVLGFGMRLLNLTGEDRRRLGLFVENFRYTVMVVASDRTLLQQITACLSDYRVIRCSSAAAAMAALQRGQAESIGVLVADETVGRVGATEFFRRVAEMTEHRHMSRVALYGTLQAEEMEELINDGRIFHCVRKPFVVADVSQSVQRGIDAYALSLENERLNAELVRANSNLERENVDLRRRVEGRVGFESILGSSPALQQALDQLERIRRCEASVHIHGETGTGKELVAHALHCGGPRADGPFVAQNCGGIAETLLQSTLFGHVKGAFTGADRDREGVFQQASGGTLFLDEVVELSAAMQAALLRVLQDGQVTPLGASRAVKVDVRVISATHKDLRREVKGGNFREDLYFRLVVLGVKLPSLRERTGDIPLLARYFLDQYCKDHGKHVRGFAPETLMLLERYHWPGNVRELQNEVQRLLVLGEENRQIPPDLISPHVRSPSLLPGDLQASDLDLPTPGSAAGQRSFVGQSYDDAVDELERSMIEWALEQTGGVVSRAAELLRMERSRLSKLRRRLGLGSAPGSSPSMAEKPGSDDRTA